MHVPHSNDPAGWWAAAQGAKWCDAFMSDVGVLYLIRRGEGGLRRLTFTPDDACVQSCMALTCGADDGRAGFPGGVDTMVAVLG